MASKKRHITNEEELLKAMRSTGYCFPTNALEQKMSLKSQQEIDISSLAKKIDPEEIWNATSPKKYKEVVYKEPKEESDEITKQWGIAAKGSANISNEIMDKIRKNQENKPKKGD